MAAEDRGPLMHAHVGMMLELHDSGIRFVERKALGTGEAEEGRIKQAGYLDGCGESGALSRLKERGRLQLKHPNVRD